MEDPYLEVRDDILRQLDDAKLLYARRDEEIRGASDPAASVPVANASGALGHALDEVRETLQDLEDAVAAIEDDPESFGLTMHDAQERRSFVRHVTAEIDGMQRDLAAPYPERTAGPGAAPDRQDSASPYEGEDGDRHASAMEMQYQQQLMEDQDEQLDSVSRTVGTLREQAVMMGRELYEHSE